ncbi:hypothetical protein ACQJBY_029227 [Aegilops geniculata]
MAMASIIVQVSALLLNLIAFGLAVAAEQRRSKATVTPDLAKELTFLVAAACLLAGSVRNAYHTRYRGIFNGDPLSCETLRKGVFAAGAAFTFFTAILSEFYYISYSKSRDAAGGAPYGGSSIGMGPYN